MRSDAARRRTHRSAPDPGESTSAYDSAPGRPGSGDPVAADANTVFLRGRLAAEAVDKPMPSGDVLTAFRLTVGRPRGERGKVDSLECVTSRARPRRTISRARPGDIVEVEGSLRRRFWRSPTGPASRYSVDVSTVRIVTARRSDRAAGASPTRKRASA